MWLGNLPLRKEPLLHILWVVEWSAGLRAYLYFACAQVVSQFTLEERAFGTHFMGGRVVRWITRLPVLFMCASG